VTTPHARLPLTLAAFPLAATALVTADRLGSGVL
jgi:hypothetical protein